MRRAFLWINVVLASIVVVGVFAQVYLIAAYAMGAGEGALDAHGFVGGLVVHGAELLIFLTAFAAWPKQWKWIGSTFLFFVFGTIQIFLLPPDDGAWSAWIHALHGLLALFVLLWAAAIARKGLRDLGVLPRRRADVDAPPPSQLP